MMAKVVASIREAIANIPRFEREVAKNADLRDRLPFARAWYAVREDDGWHFGPSKFIGYQGLNADEYVAESQELDGRRTERQLNQWFVTVGETDPLFDELSEALREFLDKHGKVPSNLARINVARDTYEANDGLDRAIADLMIAVARRLPAAEQKRLRAAL
jgi:hypothetical protein